MEIPRPDDDPSLCMANIYNRERRNEQISYHELPRSIVDRDTVQQHGTFHSTIPAEEIERVGVYRRMNGVLHDLRALLWMLA